MKKYLIIILILSAFIQIFSETKNSSSKLLINITTKKKVAHEKVFLNKNAGKYKKLLLETKNNSVKVTRLKLEFDDGTELVISDNFYISKDENFVEVYINKPGKILLKISVFITSAEDRAEKTIFNIYYIFIGSHAAP